MAKKNGAGTLSVQAYERIRNKMLSGEFPLGYPLSRRSLAEELGMSLIPVSEALQRLEAEGLVESKPRAGTRVRIPTAEDIRGHYVVREALESQSARMCRLLATKEQKRQLRETAELVDKLSAATERTDPAHRMDAIFEFERSHMRLHTLIAQCSNCPALVDAIERSRVLINNWLLNLAADLDPLPVRWHRDLIRDVCDGDMLTADESMRRHVTYRQEVMLARFQKAESNGNFATAFVRGPQKRAHRLSI